MPGPKPMHPGVRARQNKTSTAAQLEVVAPDVRAAIAVPELPSDRLWDPRTSDFWRDAWQSPMRLEWDPGDHHKLLMMAYVLDEFYMTAGASEMKQLDRAYALNKLAKTVLDLGSKMGLDPFARRSLQWLLVQTEESEARRELTQEKTRQARSEPPRKRRGLGALE